MLDMLRKIAGIFPPKERRDAIRLLGLIIVATAVEALAIWLVYPLILTLLDPSAFQRMPFLLRIHDFFGEPDPRRFLVLLLASVLAGYVVKNLYASYVAYCQTTFAFNRQISVARRLFELYLYQPYTFHMQRNSAQMITTIMNETDQLVWMVFLPGVILTAEGLITTALITLVFLVEPFAALTILVVFGSVGATYYLMLRRRIGGWGRDRQFHDWKRLVRIQEGLGGIKTVKLLGREPYFIEAFMNHSVGLARSITRFQLSATLPLLVLEVTGMASLLAVVGVALALGRSIVAVIPFLGMVAAAAFRLIPATNRILTAIQQLRYGAPALEHVYHEIQTNPRVVAADETTVAPPVLRRTLRLEKVAYRYPDTPRDVLSSVSFEIERGQSVAIVGPSGAGKTTLIDLILGLLDPTEGRIVIDERPLASIRRPWQLSIGYVPQDIFLADESVRSNIAFGVEASAIDEDAIQRCIDQAQLRQLVQSLPQGIDTVIGERGVRLSGGQIQRIGIARALYHEPEVLVLDEATSSLDTGTESEVMDAIGKLRGRKTILIIAHRLSTVEGCDLTLSVAGGTVVMQQPTANVEGGV